MEGAHNMSEAKDQKLELEEKRLAKLAKERAKMEELMIKWDDPAMSSDISENSPRDALLQQINSQEQVLLKLEQSETISNIPGTWNIGDKLFIKYVRVVCYGKDRDVPSKRIKIELVDSVDITELPEGAVAEELDIVPTAVSSPLGKALLHKAHDTVRFNTTVGYCEVEVERCLI